MSLKVVELNYVKEKIDYNGDIEDLNHINIISNSKVEGCIRYFGYKEIDNEYKVYIAFDTLIVEKYLTTFKDVYCTSFKDDNKYKLTLDFKKENVYDNVIYEIEDLKDVVMKDDLDVVIEGIKKGFNL